jgi:hypothetical protein
MSRRLKELAGWFIAGYLAQLALLVLAEFHFLFLPDGPFYLTDYLADA